MTLEQFKATAREQFFLLLLEPEAALAAIPKMLPTDIADRRKGLAAIRNVLRAGGEIYGEAEEQLRRRITTLFETNETTSSATGDDKVPFSAAADRATASSISDLRRRLRGRCGALSATPVGYYNSRL